MDRENAREGHFDLWLEASNWCRCVMASLKESWDGLSPVGKMMAIVPAVGTVLTILTTATPAVTAWDDMGLPTMATRSWVRDDNGQLKQLVSALNAKQADLQIDNVNGKIESTTAARNKLEIDALGYDPAAKIRASQEMRRLDDTINALNEQKRAIRRSQ